MPKNIYQILRAINHYYSLFGIGIYKNSCSKIHRWVLHNKVSTNNVQYTKKVLSTDETKAPYQKSQTNNVYEPTKEQAMSSFRNKIHDDIKDIKSLEKLFAYIQNIDTKTFTQYGEEYIYSPNVVLYRGNPSSPIMIIGEGPGRDEDIQRKPFVGRSGKLLDEMFKAINLSTNTDTYITNVVYWRPKNNRTPKSYEISMFKPLIMKQIDILRPRIIIAAGATASKIFIGESDLSSVRGTWIEYTSYAVMPIYHPSFLLRKAQFKKEVYKNLRDIRDRVKSLDIA